MTKILVAEDDYTMVSLLKTLLGMEGFEVGTLLDKTAGFLDVVRSEKPDVILMDIHLGTMNGLDLVRAIRSSEDQSQVKVIMTSGINMEVESREAGADVFLMKPYMADELIKIIRSQAEA